MSTSNRILEAKLIKKSYGNLEVLKGVNLDIYSSEIVSIMGKSGSGKSTLLHILGSIDKPDSGKLSIANTSIINLKQKDLAKFRNLKIGFVFQFHHLLNEFTALENIIMPALIGGLDRSKAEKKAFELLKYMNLLKRENHKPNQLSGGEQQRIAVARALINDPVIVFADEPSGNLDQETSEDLHNLFLKLRNDFNQTFVLVTHNEELGKMSDRMLIMEDGLFKNHL